MKERLRPLFAENAVSRKDRRITPVVKHLLENGYDVRTLQEYGALKRLYEDHLWVVFSNARHGSSQSGPSNKNSRQPAVTSTVDLNDVFVGIGISMISAENSLRFV
jgi:hypothetical protein